MIESRLQILRRICERGRLYFRDKQDSSGVDLFTHMEHELELLSADLGLPFHPGETDAKETNPA